MNKTFNSLLVVFPSLYAMSLFKPFLVYALVIKLIMLVIVVLPAAWSLLKSEPKVSREYIIFFAVLLVVFVFSIQLAMSIGSAYWLARCYVGREKVLLNGASLLLVVLAIVMVLIKLNIIENNLIQVDKLLNRERYDLGFKYVTTMSVLLMFPSMVYFAVGKKYLLLVAVLFSFFVMNESGTRSGFFYSAMLLGVYFCGSLLRRHYNYLVVIVVLIILGVVTYQLLGYEYLNLILSDRLRQNFELFNAYEYNPLSPLRSDFIFLNILHKSYVLGLVIIIMLLYLSSGRKFSIQGKYGILFLLAFLADSGGTILSIILMFAFLTPLDSGRLTINRALLGRKLCKKIPN